MIVLTWLYRIGQLVLAAVFIWAGLTKLWAPKAFARLISAYDLVPDPLLAPVAIGLPLIEVMAGLGLLLGIRGSLGTIAGLTVLFLGVLGYALLNNMDVDCGCFSPDEIHAQQTLRIAFIRDLGLLAIAAYLMAWRRARKRATVW
ncbi:MAG: MauE/DoxX family redox-associated membrane protein [Syntrophobacteraceae bacterium]